MCLCGRVINAGVGVVRLHRNGTPIAKGEKKSLARLCTKAEEMSALVQRREGWGERLSSTDEGEARQDTTSTMGAGKAKQESERRMFRHL